MQTTYLFVSEYKHTAPNVHFHPDWDKMEEYASQNESTGDSYSIFKLEQEYMHGRIYNIKTLIASWHDNEYRMEV